MPGDLAGALPSGMPTAQTFYSGSGTYTPSSSTVTWIRVRMVAGGGAGDGASGGITSFAGWSCGGGGRGGGASDASGGTGGVPGTGGASGTGTVIMRRDGLSGFVGMAIGGALAQASFTTTATAARAGGLLGFGSGGAGGASATASFGGGGSGATVKCLNS